MSRRAGGLPAVLALAAALGGAPCAFSQGEPPLPLGLDGGARAKDAAVPGDSHGVSGIVEPALPAGLRGGAGTPEPVLPTRLGGGAGTPEPVLPEGLGGGASTAEPALPAGLGGSVGTGEPSLPAGLGGSAGTGEPSLPAGLAGEAGTGGPNPPAPTGGTDAALPGEHSHGLPGSPDVTISGFVEARAGGWLRDRSGRDDAAVAETRVQVDLESNRPRTAFALTVDFVLDGVDSGRSINLETGLGPVDVREASFLVRPVPFADLKIGRQILTWGTGDLVFVNDLFPKDINSFLIGRDVEYLKAPSDAVKLALFSGLANLDVVYTPRFDADRFAEAPRTGLFDPLVPGRVKAPRTPRADPPRRWLRDDELALRLHRTLAGWEFAAYGYRGFWKSPAGRERASGAATHPALSVYGASVRGPVAGGIGYLEFGHYDSKDDRDGDDPLVRNGELRILAGYERELAPDFTAGVQYLLEHMRDHGAYLRALVPGLPAADQNRHLVTLRLTRRLLNQNLELSLFTFYSPSDQDAYLRPRVSYKMDDHWRIEAGANVFLGRHEHTAFGQFEDDTNIYAALRRGF